MNKKQKFINIVIAGFLMMVWYGGVQAAVSVGKAVEVFGKTEELKYTRQDKSARLIKDLPLQYQDDVITGHESSAQLLLEDPASKIKAAFYVFEDSKFTLDKEVIEKTGKKIVVKHTQGTLGAVVKGIKKGEELRIVTPHATLGVRGSSLIIEVDRDTVKTWVEKGSDVFLTLKDGREFHLISGKVYRVEEDKIRIEISEVPESRITKLEALKPSLNASVDFKNLRLVDKNTGNPITGDGPAKDRQDIGER